MISDACRSIFQNRQSSVVTSFPTCDRGIGGSRDINLGLQTVLVHQFIGLSGDIFFRRGWVPQPLGRGNLCRLVTNTPHINVNTH